MRTYEIWATEDDRFAMDFVAVAASDTAEAVAMRKVQRAFGISTIYYVRSVEAFGCEDAAFRFSDWQDNEIAGRLQR